MSDMFLYLHDQMSPNLRRGDLDACVEFASRVLAGIPHTPFHRILEESITNDPAEVARYFDRFFEHESTRFKIEAAYTETNGFDINTNRWYFSAFALEEYGGHEDYDWLSGEQSELSDNMTITGLESIQAVYANHRGVRSFADAERCADFLFILKFQDPIRRSAPFMQNLRFPLLATAHDFDFIFEIRPV